MRALEEINKARDILCNRALEPGLDKYQMALLSGMLNGLVWVAEGQNCRTLELILAGEPFPTQKK